MPKRLLAAFLIVLFLAHQDIWWRSDARLVLGILPISLAYHVFWTLLTALAWYLVTKFAWPHELDDAEPRPSSAAPPIATGNGRGPK